MVVSKRQKLVAGGMLVSWKCAVPSIVEDQVDDRNHGEEKDESDDERSHVLSSLKVGV